MTLEELKIRQLTNQYLLAPADKLTVMRDLCGVQAQFMTNALHSLKIRTNDYDEQTVADGLVKNWSVRGTVHVFAESDLPLFIRCNNGADYRKNEWQGYSYMKNQRPCWALTPERQKYLADIIISAVSERAYTRDELKELCRANGMTKIEEDCMFESWGGGIRELCVRGFMNYTVQEKKQYIASPEFSPIPEEEAKFEIARRYFTNIAPATIHDAMYYTGAKQAEVKNWLRDLPVESFDFGGMTYYYIADSLRIPYQNLRWYAAFHNEGTHPHVHLMAYSANPKEGYLSNKGIESLRSSLANDIFADELHNIFAEQTDIRDTLMKDWKELVTEYLSALDATANPHTELQEKLLLLAEKLRNTKGKKIYGYLKKDVKDLINSIVDLMANDENIAKLYDLWWEKKCDVLRTYYQNIPYEKPPLSQNKEFKSLKNDIIREALKIGGYLDAGQRNGSEKNGSGTKRSGSQSHSYSPQTHKVTATAVTGLLRSLAGIFRDKIQKEDKKIYRADRRQEREEEQKRNAEFDMIM